jgi:LysR family transcriptional regulator, regulator for bpeEF and oprC
LSTLMDNPPRSAVTLGHMNQFDAIRVFTRMVETGSLTKAAASLAMPKSTASKLLAELEAHLGAKLLQRSTRSFSLTNEGEDYYERVTRLMAHLHDIDATIQQRGAGLSGRIRVDVHSSMANMIIIPALHQFRALHPGIQIALGIGDKPVGLIEEAVDCVVRLGKLVDTSLVARTIYQDRLVTCASPAYLSQTSAPVHPGQLGEGHQLVGYFSKATGEVRPMVFTKGGEKIDIDHASILTNDSTGYVNMLLAGFGVGQTYHSTVKSYLASGELVSVLDDWTSGGEPLSVLYHPSKRKNVRVRAFIDWLTDYLAKN